MNRSDCINWEVYNGEALQKRAKALRTAPEIQTEISRLEALQGQKWVNYRNTRITELSRRLLSRKEAANVG